MLLASLKLKSVLYIDIDSHEKTQIEKLLINLFNKFFFADNDTDAITIYKEQLPHLVVTSSKAKQINGVELIEQFRQHNYNLPIIVLSTSDKKEICLDIVNQSIDAYLHKPLNMTEFKNAIFKSINRNSYEEEIISLNKNIFFNNSTQELISDGSIITLGIKERKLLLLLIKNHFKPVTKKEIAYVLSMYDPLSESAIKKLILRLRKKIGTNTIVSVRGIGYKLNTQSDICFKQKKSSCILNSSCTGNDICQ